MPLTIVHDQQKYVNPHDVLLRPTISQPGATSNKKEESASNKFGTRSTKYSSTFAQLLPSPSQLFHDEAFTNFVHDLPFDMTFTSISYPQWCNNSAKPLHYLPVPTTPLPGIPAIPNKLEISFTQVTDDNLFADTINEILHSNGYNLAYVDVWKVYIGFTHRDGKRTRVAVQVQNVSLITLPWAKDVWLNHLDVIAGNCACQECVSETKERVRYGHGLEIEVVFSQGMETRRRGLRRKEADVESWGGKPKLPYRNVVKKRVGYADLVRRI